MRIRYALSVYFVLMLGVFGGGCVSNTSGSSALTADNVKLIQKGVTTSAEVEAIFGPPENVSMAADGKHVMQYYFEETNMHADPQTFIPIVQMFAAKSEGESTTRSLQIELDGNDVVQNYQFNDGTNHLEVGQFGSSSTPVPTPAPVNPSPP